VIRRSFFFRDRQPMRAAVPIAVETPAAIR
jgi:hypothetical protein